MFRKYFLLSLMTIVCSSIVSAQQLKTFVNKDYETEDGQEGTLTYTYYEGNNGDYVKHGKFSINASATLPKSWDAYKKMYVTRTEKYSASANYKNGWLHGTLTIIVTTKDVYINQTKVYVSTLTANFSNGLPNGNWKMTRTENGVKTYSLSANFSNGVLVGSFNIDNNLIGQLDNEGYFSGKWIEKDGSHSEYEYNFVNRVFISKYKRENGKVIWSEPETETEKEAFKKYANGQLSADELMKYGYYVDTSYNSKYPINTSFMNDILYSGNDGFCLSDIDGDKTFTKECKEKVIMGRYIKLQKAGNDIHFFKNEEEFDLYAKKIKKYLETELFEDEYSIDSAQLLWKGCLVNQKQKDRLIEIYNNYVNEMLPKKLKQIEEEKKKAEEAARKAKEKALREYVDVAINKMISLSSSNASIKLFGADIVIATDYDSDSEKWNALFSSQSSLRDKLGKQLKDFFPVKSYKIDSVNIDNRIVYCTLEKYNKKEGSQYWQTQVIFNSRNIDLDRSFDFQKAVRIKGDWDIIRDLQSSIVSNKANIENQAGKDCPDITKTYNEYHKNCKLKASEDSHETIERLTKVTKVQQSYLKFIGLRKQVLTKQNQIIEKCAKDYSDVTKSYQSFMKGYNVSMSSDSTESYQRIEKLINIQDSCLQFINLRKIISDNNKKLLDNKDCKNIIKTYAQYMKSQDLSWSSDMSVNNRLRDIEAMQQRFISAVSNSNAINLDSKIKKLKDKSINNVLKELGV